MLQNSLHNQEGSLAVAFLPCGDATALKETLTSLKMVFLPEVLDFHTKGLLPSHW